MTALNVFSLDRVMVDSIIEKSRIMNVSASVPVAGSKAVEYNDDTELMEKMQDENSDGEDEPDFDLDRDMHE